jgi:hypothetical protein
MSYDLQSYGSIRSYVKDPDHTNNLLTVFTSQLDSNDAPEVNKFVYFSYSTDNGYTWSGRDEIDNTSSNGFPCLSTRVTNIGTVPIIAMQYSARTGIKLFQDAVFTGFGWAEMRNIPQIGSGIQQGWPHICVTSNGSLILEASSLSDPFNAASITYNTFYWSNWTQYNYMSSPTGNFSIESGTGGLTGIFGQAYNSENQVTYFKSTNNGISFDAGTTIFSSQIDGDDTLFADNTAGMQCCYFGVDPHLIFTVTSKRTRVVNSDPNTKYFPKTKLLHWSPSTGITFAATYNSIINFEDTLTQSRMAPLCQPSIGVTPNGTLVCTFTGFIKGDKQTAKDGTRVNAGEIFITISTNGGLTWSNSRNLTNTSGIEEKNSSLLRKFSADSLSVYFVRDMMAGSWVLNPSWGKTPVYGIFHFPSHYININEDPQFPSDYKLEQNYPNPFNPATTIKYSLRKAGYVTLKVYDLLGREAAVIVNGYQDAGEKQFVFDAKDLAGGIYFYTLVSGDFKETKKMMVVK